MDEPVISPSPGIAPSAFDDPGFEPRRLSQVGEIRAQLRLLSQQRVPLLLRFPGHDERYRSQLVALPREHALIGLDEPVPAVGAELLLTVGDVTVVGYLDGVRISWSCRQTISQTFLDGLPCYWLPLPDVLEYYQRREDFRVRVALVELPPVDLAGQALNPPVQTQLLDISAAGCRLGLSGDQRLALGTGEPFELLLRIPGKSPLRTTAHVRHMQYHEPRLVTIVGLQFGELDAALRRGLQQWVSQLQREAHRAREDRFY